MMSMRYINLLVIAVATILVPWHVVKSQILIWRLGTRRWNLRVPNLQMSQSDEINQMKYMAAQSSNESQGLDSKIGHLDSSSNNGHQSDMPYWWYDTMHEDTEVHLFAIKFYV